MHGPASPPPPLPPLLLDRLTKLPIEDNLTTWHCPPLCPECAAALPAALIYVLGDHGLDAARDMFGFSSEALLGPLYLVMYTAHSSIHTLGPPPHRLSTVFWSPAALGDRTCERVSEATSHTRFSLKLRSTHYASSFAFNKLDVLLHLPSTVERAVLLDVDTFCIDDCIARLGREMAQLDTPRQWLTASRTGTRVRLRSPDGEDPAVNRLHVPPQWDGINSGVVGFDVRAFRAFAAGYCDGGGRSWWRCVLESRNSSFD